MIFGILGSQIKSKCLNSGKIMLIDDVSASVANFNDALLELRFYNLKIQINMRSDAL